MISAKLYAIRKVLGMSLRVRIKFIRKRHCLLPRMYMRLCRACTRPITAFSPSSGLKRDAARSLFTPRSLPPQLRCTNTSISSLEWRRFLSGKVDNNTPEDKVNVSSSGDQAMASGKQKFTPIEEVPGSKSSGEKYVIMYTCKVCNLRSAKKITKHSYHKGVVVVRCAGCNNMHLIADHLGIFENPGWTIENVLKEHGDSIDVINNDNILEFIKKSDVPP